MRKAIGAIMLVLLLATLAWAGEECKLKEDTAATVKMGPALDKTDFVTEETGLSPTVKLSKNGAGIANRNSATSITHDTLGYYDVPLDATDTDTAGRLLVLFHDNTAHLPVTKDCFVYPANVYDSLVGSDTLQVEATALSATAADHVWDEALEGSYTARNLMRLASSILFGKASGGGTSTITFRDLGDSKDRVTMTVDSKGNRSAVSLDGD